LLLAETLLRNPARRGILENELIIPISLHEPRNIPSDFTRSNMTMRAKHVAVAGFISSWDEAITLHRSLRQLRKQLREAYNIDNVQMRFKNPWRGPRHTEFTLAVELGKGGTAATARAVTKWLFDMVGDFVKEYRKKAKKTKSPSSNQRKPRPGRAKKKIRKS
jgi:hypothetical protein